MKSARRIACGFLQDHFDICWTENSINELTSLIEEYVNEAKKDQDKITRHACAEAVSYNELDFMKTLIDRDEAHKRCMNVKAV